MVAQLAQEDKGSRRKQEKGEQKKMYKGFWRCNICWSWSLHTYSPCLYPMNFELANLILITNLSRHRWKPIREASFQSHATPQGTLIHICLTLSPLLLSTPPPKKKKNPHMQTRDFTLTVKFAFCPWDSSYWQLFRYLWGSDSHNTALGNGFL